MTTGTMKDRLVRSLKTSGMRQSVLAAAVGVTQGMVSRWLAGAEPKASQLAALARALGVSTDYLLTGQDPPCRLDPAELPQPVVRFAGSLGGAGMVAEQAAEYGLRLEEYRAVPLVADAVAAGAPVVVRDQVDGWAFVYGPLVRKRRNLVAVRVRGDSMTPVLPDGAVVVVDRDDRRIVRGGVYVVRIDDAVTVKYLTQEERALVLIPENREHRETRVPIAEGQESPVVGRVCFSWRAWV